MWWKTDLYEGDVPIPVDLLAPCGPNGIALVRVWSDGKTDPGWGLTDKKNNPAFMPRYNAGRFRAGPILTLFQQRGQPFALVMRSLRVVCIDIDGKNGGLEHVGELGMLPYTMAETSKSGDGYHLFYTVSDDDWDVEAGFGKYADKIGIVQGVDFRGTGCVYHHPQQRWNDRPLAELPQHLKDRLIQRQQAAVAQTDAIIKLLDSGAEEEVLVMQDALLSDLAKPIPAGRRNNTLFAIGQKLKLAQVPGWEQALEQRALDVGLHADEATKLVSNVVKYN